MLIHIVVKKEKRKVLFVLIMLLLKNQKYLSYISPLDFGIFGTVKRTYCFLVSSVHFHKMIKAKSSRKTCFVQFDVRHEKRKLKRERQLIYKKALRDKKLNIRKLDRLEKIEQVLDPQKESYLKLCLECDPLPIEIEKPNSNRHYKKETSDNNVRFRNMNSNEEYSCFEDEDWEEWKEIADAFKYQERIQNE